MLSDLCLRLAPILLECGVGRRAHPLVGALVTPHTSQPAPSSQAHSERRRFGHRAEEDPPPNGVSPGWSQQNLRLGSSSLPTDSSRAWEPTRGDDGWVPNLRELFPRRRREAPQSSSSPRRWRRLAFLLSWLPDASFRIRWCFRNCGIPSRLVCLRRKTSLVYRLAAAAASSRRSIKYKRRLCEREGAFCRAGAI